MSKTRIQLSRLDTKDDPHKKIQVEVFYDKGGMNMLAGESTKRGYCVAARPVEDKGDGVVSFALFSGIKSFIEPANRFSRKKLEALAEKLRTDETWKGAVKLLVQRVCEHEKIRLNEGAKV